jgi:hypothetical protein
MTLRVVKRLRSEQGNTLLIALITITVAAWTAGLVTIAVQAQSRRQIAKQFSQMALSYTATESVVNRITQKLLQELTRPTPPAVYTGTLNHLFTPHSNNYNVAYSKGDFVQPFPSNSRIKLIMPTDTSLASRPLFVAPETDPMVQVRRINKCFFRIRVNFQYCGAIIGGRLPFNPSASGLGTPWSPACPADQTMNRQRTAYLDIGSPSFRKSQAIPCTLP